MKGKLQKKLLEHQLVYNVLVTHEDVDKPFTYKKRVTSRELFEYLCGEPVLQYPLKAYAVAVVYALLLEKHFGVSFYDSLDNEMLLSGNDVFFKPYRKNKKVYKGLFLYTTKSELLEIGSPTIIAISEYFYKEFGELLKKDLH